jgi:hypothetical protein
VAHVVALAEFDSMVAEDVVGGHDVEIEVRERPRPQILQAVHRDHSAAVRYPDAAVAILGPVEVHGLGALEVFDRLRDAGLQIADRLLVVFDGRWSSEGRFLATETRNAVPGLSARDPNLLGERISVYMSGASRALARSSFAAVACAAALSRIFDRVCNMGTKLSMAMVCIDILICESPACELYRRLRNVAGRAP